MKKIYLLSFVLILSACSSQPLPPQVTVTSQVTVTLAFTNTPLPTQTPQPTATPTIIPIPTFSPETWATMDQTARDEALAKLPAESPEGYKRDKFGTANDTLVKYLADDGSIGSVYDVTTGTFLSPGEAGKIDFATITQVNGKGESITIPEFGKEEFDTNIQYIAKNVQWGNGDRNEANRNFAFDPELDIFLEQFRGVAGFTIKKNWSVHTLPLSFSNSVDFFNVYFGTCGSGTLEIFKNKDGNFEAIYSDLNIHEILDDKIDDPIMATLHP